MVFFSLKRFYEKCGRVFQGVTELEPDGMKERYTAISRRAIEYKQTLINLRKDLIPLEIDGHKAIPQNLLEEDMTYKPTYIEEDEGPQRATIVTWTHAVPSETYHAAREYPGVAKAMIDMLEKNPHPRYWDVINQLPLHLQTYQSLKGKEFMVVSDRVQLSSIKPLDLTETMTL